MKWGAKDEGGIKGSSFVKMGETWYAGGNNPIEKLMTHKESKENC